MFLVAGLGNPGKDYVDTRHNIGFKAIDYLSNVYGISINKIKHKALIGEGIMQGEKVMLAKPQTFVNNSGESIKEICRYYKIPISSIIIIYDDIALETGKIRIRPKGSDGGHNGMKSIIYHLGSENFTRVRIGIGAPKSDMISHVLGRFTDEEAAVVRESIQKMDEIVPIIMKLGVQFAMNKYN